MARQGASCLTKLFPVQWHWHTAADPHPSSSDQVRGCLLGVTNLGALLGICANVLQVEVVCGPRSDTPFVRGISSAPTPPSLHQPLSTLPYISFYLHYRQWKVCETLKAEQICNQYMKVIYSVLGMRNTFVVCCSFASVWFHVVAS